MQHIAEHCSLHATKINVIGLIGGTFVNPNLSFCWVFTHIRIKIVQRNGREDGNMNFWDHFELLSHNHVANKPGKWPTGGGLPWCDQTWAKHVWFVVLKFDVSDIGFLSQCSASFLVCLELYSELASSPVCMMKIDYPYLLMVSIHWLSIVSWNSLACDFGFRNSFIPTTLPHHGNTIPGASVGFRGLPAAQPTLPATWRPFHLGPRAARC